MSAEDDYNKLMGISAPLTWNKRLKALREKTGKTAEQFAKSIGISFYTYRHYEQGTREPSLAKLRLLADALGVVTDDILPSTEIDSEDVLDIPTRRLLMLLDISTGKLNIDDFITEHADKDGIDILGVETDFGITFDSCSDIISRNEETRAAAVKAHIGKLIALIKGYVNMNEADALGIAAAEAMGFNPDEFDSMLSRTQDYIIPIYESHKNHSAHEAQLSSCLLNILCNQIETLMFTYFVGHMPWLHDPWKKTHSIGFLERRLLNFFLLDERLCRRHFGDGYEAFLPRLYDRYLMSMIICDPHVKPILKTEWEGLFTADGISKLDRYKHRFAFPTSIGNNDMPFWEENGTIDTGMTYIDEDIIIFAQKEAGHLERFF